MCSISRSCSVIPPQTPYGSRTTPGADARAVFTSRDNGAPRAVLLFEPADRVLLQERRVTLPLRNAYADSNWGLGMPWWCRTRHPFIDWRQGNCGELVVHRLAGRRSGARSPIGSSI
jgi:hypothetical protein